MNNANVVSLSRGLLALVLFLLYWAGATSEVLVTCAIVMWSTDALDGWLARRRGISLGKGEILDPSMDDIALFVVFLILLETSAVPLWFVVLLAVSRVLFLLVRTVGLAQTRQFVGSQPITKLSGACLAIGQCWLLAGIGYTDFVVVIMTVVLCISMYSFLIRQHGKVLLSLVRYGPWN